MSYKVTVHREKIVALIQTGKLNGFTFQQAKKVERTARAIAPKRSGALVASHKTLRTSGTNQYVVRYRVSADAGHARYVYHGTHGPITGRNGWVKLPGRNPSAIRTGSSTVVRSVRGQRANPWLLRAAHIVAAQI